MATLSKADISVLKELIREVQSRRGVAATRPATPEPDIQAPEVYIARTPLTGVPALTAAVGTGTGTGAEAGDYPGYADCQLYRILGQFGSTPYIESLGVPVRRVFNCSKQAVPGGIWILVARDKIGAWWALAAAGIEDVGTGTGTGGNGAAPSTALCNFAALKSTDCLRAITSLQQITLFPDGNTWSSDPVELEHPGGSGVVTATWSVGEGRFKVAVGGLYLLEVGDGCWCGGPLTGHSVGTGSLPGTACEGDTFMVCIGCQTCPVITNPCCGEDVDIPRRLTATLGNLGPTNVCPCSNAAEIELLYNEDTDAWEGTGPFGTCGYDITIKAYCDVFTMRFDYSFSNNCATAVTGQAFSSQDCEPIEWAASIGNVAVEGCAGCNSPPDFSSNLRIIVTE